MSPISPTTVIHGSGGFRHADVDALADGVLAGPIVLRESAVDDHHQRSARGSAAVKSRPRRIGMPAAPK